MDDYGVTSADYLKRAEERLKEGTKEALFYAAFELRCGVEARYQQYLEAQHHVSEKKKQDWQIPELGNSAENIESGFGGKRVAMFEFSTGDLEETTTLYYTPISTELQMMTGKLNDYCRVMQTYKEPDDPWWNELRSFLENVAYELAKANAGNLLGLPLVSPEGKVKVYAELDDGTEDLQAIGRSDEVSLRIRYFDEYPERLLPDQS